MHTLPRCQRSSQHSSQVDALHIFPKFPQPTQVFLGWDLAPAARLRLRGGRSTASPSTVLLVDYKGAPRSVVGVTGTDPRVVGDEENIKRIRDEVSFRAERASSYAEGFVQFKSQQASGMRFVATYDAANDPATSGGTLASTGY